MGFRLAIFALPMLLAAADAAKPKQVRDVRVTEHLGEKVDLNLEFVAESGKVVPLKNYFQSGKPVLLNLVYYRCPMLCNLVLNGQIQALRNLDWTAGDQFEIVTISIDPTETFDLAREKKLAYLASYERANARWNFLSDHQGNAKRLASQIGFNYSQDAKTGQFYHPAVVFVMSPEGMMSRYLYGLLRAEKARDLRFGFIEAAQERFGITERILMWCFHYDPSAGSYVPLAKNFMKIGGGAVALTLIGLLARLWLWERERGFAPSLPAPPVGM
jgi:protein SCO1/2